MLLVENVKRQTHILATMCKSIGLPFDLEEKLYAPTQNLNVQTVTLRQIFSGPGNRNLKYLESIFDAPVSVQNNEIQIRKDQITPEQQHVVEQLIDTTKAIQQMCQQNYEKYAQNQKLIEFAQWYERLPPDQIDEARAQLVEQMKTMLGQKPQ